MGSRSYCIDMGRAQTKSAKGTSRDQVTRVIGYCRVSTQTQVDEGVSLEAQQAQLSAYATLYGLQIVDMIVDAGESAKSLDRPGLQRALDALARGAG